MTTPTPEQRIERLAGMAQEAGPANSATFYVADIRALLATTEPGEDGLRACGICGDYTAQGVEVHEVCLAALRAPVADAGLDLWQRATLTVATASLPRTLVGVQATRRYIIGLLDAEYARLAATPTEPDAFAGYPDQRKAEAIPGDIEPDASFDDPVLEADPAPTWKGGLPGTDHG